MKKLIIAGIIFLNIGVGAAAFAQEQQKSVLPLDHGPHAATTPWANEQRRLRAESEGETASAYANKSSLRAGDPADHFKFPRLWPLPQAARPDRAGQVL
jgi:hypothetical protein